MLQKCSWLKLFCCVICSNNETSVLACVSWFRVIGIVTFYQPLLKKICLSTVEALWKRATVETRKRITSIKNETAFWGDEEAEDSLREVLWCKCRCRLVMLKKTGFLIIWSVQQLQYKFIFTCSCSCIPFDVNQEFEEEKKNHLQIDTKHQRLMLAFADVKGQVQHGDFKIENYDKVKRWLLQIGTFLFCIPLWWSSLVG